MPVDKQIQIRRDTAANWTSVNPVLTSGEFGLETDTRKTKIGDGVTAWTALAYYPGTIVGITGTKAQFDTAVTDGNFLYVGDVTQYTDEMAQDAVGGMVDSTLVYVDGTPLLTRAALTGDITAPQASNATTLATVNGNVGSFTYASLTVNAKGLITAASSGTTPFILPAYTTGSVLFSDGSTIAQDNANFFWADSTNRLGIGTALPQSDLDIQGPVGTGATCASILTLGTKELTIVNGDELGRINFNAPLESDGGDAILPGASVWAAAAATFSSTVNSTDIVFGTATTSAPIERMRLTSAGQLRVSGTATPGDTTARIVTTMTAASTEERHMFMESQSSSTRAEFVIANSNSGGSWTNNFFDIAVHGSTYAANNYLGTAVTDAGLGMLLGQGSNMTNMAVGMYNNVPVHFFNNNTIRMTIAAGGNVGIGGSSSAVATTTSKFNVGDTAQFQVTSTGLVLAPAGAVTTPSYAAVADPNTGMYLPGSDIIRFANNGANTVSIIANGNTGFGQATPTAVVHLKAGTTAADTAPLKFTSGALNTAAVAGQVEFLTDAYYGTITTGAVRKTFAFLESPAIDTPTLTTPVFAGNPTGTVTSGVYTPTLTNGANVAASTAYEFQYMRVGNTVTVSGPIDVDPTLAATITVLGLSLPIASNFGAGADCSGTGATGASEYPCILYGDAANDRAIWTATPSSLANQTWWLNFTYQVI